ncbi:hypothetical protein, partial [Phenylobacterium sp.]|uniref:hypothetical protein n=1 Tax=Phenylobacterium sp. TaxID=1871053 RepID=UPI002DE6D7B3|nr:hypothetical protein [Phenylobacterium sp.]
MRPRLLILPLALAGGLTACDRQAQPPPATGAPIASLPLAEGAAPPTAYAPIADQLPPAPPVLVRRPPPRARYSYIDRAYAMGQAFGESPPDYTVDYQGERPWIWRSENGDYRVVEPTPDGERDYYYSGDSDEPFLVRDPQYAYGYDQGALVVIYDARGRPMDYDARAAERSARYLARARALHAAALHDQRQAAYAAAWRARRNAILDQQQAWQAQQQQDSEWRAWHADHQSEDHARWDREQAMRQAYAAQLAPRVAPERRPQPSYQP